MHIEVWEALEQKIYEDMMYKCVVSWNLLQWYAYEDTNLALMKNVLLTVVKFFYSKIKFGESDVNKMAQ